MSVGITVVVLVVLGLLGGLFLLLPSPGDKRRMALRQRAFSQGVRVREARAEMQEWKIDVQDAGMLMQYYVHNPKAKEGRWSVANPSPIVSFQATQAKDDLPAPLLPSEWASLPSDLLLWERVNQRYGFYWFEKGDEATLDNAIQLLKRLEANS